MNKSDITLSLFIIVTLIIGGSVCQRRDRQRSKFRFRSRNQDKEICKDKFLNVNFRKQEDIDRDNCKTYYKCTSRTKTVQGNCNDPLVFDVDLQTCNYLDQVDNCNRTTKVEVCKGDEFDLPNCIVKVEEENNIVVEEEKSKEGQCDPVKCVLPECFCSVDGTLAPGVDGKAIQQVSDLPQMISLSFNGAVNGENIGIYQEIFKKDRVNPNGCTVKGTFFVSHKYTNYSAVQELHRLGQEIGTFSISSSDSAEYWSQGSEETWAREMAGNRKILELFSNITDSSIFGVRAPLLKTGGNNQFSMMNYSFFSYDSSITVPLSDKPVWPYTLDYRVPHPCHNNNCPTESFPIWEIPINELDRREDPTFDEQLTGCGLVSSCTNVQEVSQFRTLLEYNFKRHYTTNRAPLVLAFNPSWLVLNKGFVQELSNWMDSVLSQQNDVYFVTGTEILLWMTEPTALLDIKEFPPWKEKCQVGGQPACSRPNVCPLTSRELPFETNRLHTCMQCPRFYPWLQDLNGDGDVDFQF